MKELISFGNIPECLYIELDNETHKQVWNLLSSKSVVEVSNKFSIPIRNLYKYKEGESGYPIKHFKKLLDATHISLKSAMLKPQHNGKKININLPIMVSEELAEFLGHLFGDGGIDKQLQVHYTTNDKNFLNRFDFLLHKIFGDSVGKRIIKYDKRITYYYPKVIGVLLESIGINKGNKVNSDIKLPPEIKDNFNDKMKIAFIKAFYECDGESERIRIIQAGKTNKEPTILMQIKEMLEELGFYSVVIEPSSMYKTQKTLRRRWVLKIKDKNEKKKFIVKIEPTKLSQLIIRR